MSTAARGAIFWAVASVAASPAQAQSPAAVPQAPPSVAASPDPSAQVPPAASAPATPDHVAEGTYVVIELAEPVSSRTIKRGDMFKIRLAAAVTLGERVVIPAGTPGMGQVIDAAPSGALGRPAKLLLAARYLDVNGVRVPLRAMQLGGAGTDKTDVILAAGFIPYVGILADFMHGGEIEIPAGTLARAKLGADVAAPAAEEPAPAAATTPVTANAEAPPKSN